MRFGDVLRKERLQKGLSQEDLGKLVNKSKNNISQYELGKREPDNNTLQLFADIFNCSTDFILGRTDIRNNESTLLSSSDINDILNQKDVKDIEENLKEIEKKLLNSEGLMLNGELATPEAIQSIIDAMRIGLEMAKQRNKQKYTPDKHKK